ncbi:MAG: hypothetical protein FJ033_09885 [Chloroflexi bacterium]|nr:hypothetical protein [Chloroflexota bacterium]
MRAPGAIHDYTIEGREARDFRELHERGHLDRGAPLVELRRVIARRAPAASYGRDDPLPDVDFELVDDAQLRGWLSERVLERRQAREVGGR